MDELCNAADRPLSRQEKVTLVVGFLEAKFGELPDGLRERIALQDEDNLQEIFDSAVDAVTLDEALSDLPERLG